MKAPPNGGAFPSPTLPTHSASLDFYADMLDDLTEGGLCEIHTTGGDIRVTIEE